MSDHIATMKSGDIEVCLIDFGRPVWSHLPDPETLEVPGTRVVPQLGFEIRDALIYFFSRPLGLSVGPTNTSKNDLIDVNDDPNNPVRMQILDELSVIDLSDIELVVFGEAPHEFADEIEGLNNPPRVRSNSDGDLDLSVTPFGSLVRGISDVSAGRVRRVDELLGD